MEKPNAVASPNPNCVDDSAKSGECKDIPLTISVATDVLKNWYRDASYEVEDAFDDIRCIWSSTEDELPRKLCATNRLFIYYLVILAMYTIQICFLIDEKLFEGLCKIIDSIRIPIFTDKNMWNFSVVLLLFIHLVHDFAAGAKIGGNFIYNPEVKHIDIADTPENCIFVSSETGYFTYKSTTNSSVVCGIYLMTGSQQLVEITFTKFDVPCDKNDAEGGLVQYLDGWELQGAVFPSTEDLSQNWIEDTEFCSTKTPLDKTFISSQNGAQILYRIPHIGKGFTIFVNHKKHPFPCNIIHIDEPYYLLQNYGKKKNCSIWASYPTTIQFNSYNVGYTKSGRTDKQQCAHSSDHIEIGGGDLDTNRIQILDTVCGKSQDYNGAHENSIDCSSTTVKLVSSGKYHNKVNISMQPIDFNRNLVVGNHKYSCISSIK